MNVERPLFTPSAMPRVASSAFVAFVDIEDERAPVKKLKHERHLATQLK